LNSKDWKNQIIASREAQESNVFIISTPDHKREKELEDFLKTLKLRGMDEKTTPRLLRADAFEGLFEWDRQEEEWKQLQATEESPFGSTSADLASTAREADKIVKEETAYLVIRGVTTPELARSITLALQNWSTHEALTGNFSTVFVVTQDAYLFDDHTRRIAVLVEPPYSTEEERKTIVENIAKRVKATYDELIVSASRGLTLHDLETCTFKSIASTKPRKITLEAITNMKMATMRKAGYELVYPRLGWEAIGGYATLKQYFSNHVIEIIKDDIARKWGVGASRGIMLFGIGGTGKTLFAKAMAKELGLPFIKISSTELFGGIVGESERKVRNLTKVAEENAPCIVFIDEIDQIAMKRGMVLSTDSGVSRRVQNMLMDWMGDDERKAIIVGATNLMPQLDDAFIRAGRFDDKIPLLPPDTEARRDILRVHSQVMRNIPLSLTPEEEEKIVEDTSLYTGAEIELLVVSSARIARTRKQTSVDMTCIQEAFEVNPINFTRRTKEIEEFIRETKEAQNYNVKLLEEQLNAILQFQKKEAKDRLSKIVETFGE